MGEGAGGGAGLVVVEEEEEEIEGLGGLRGGAALVRVEGAVDYLGTRLLAMEAEAEEMVEVDEVEMDEVEVEGRDTAVGAFLTGLFSRCGTTAYLVTAMRSSQAALNHNAMLSRALTERKEV
jgi:K+-transporting ATPase A subunit